jgi:hypothetical protein
VLAQDFAAARDCGQDFAVAIAVEQGRDFAQLATGMGGRRFRTASLNAIAAT